MINIIRIIVLLSFLTNLQIFSQFSSIDIKANVGDNIKIPIIYSGTFTNDNEVLFSTKIKINRPTVFHPKAIIKNINSLITNDTLSRINDTTYNLKCALKINDSFKSGDTIFFLMGELLAGNDYYCDVTFSNISFNDTDYTDFSLRIDNNYNPGQLLYAKPPIIFNYYPNPCYPGNNVKLLFNIDQDSKIKIVLYNIQGYVIFNKDFGLTSKGKHEFIFSLDKTTSSGYYMMVMENDFGNLFKPLVVVK